MRTTVSAVIPTKNVAEKIGPTLDSLRFCDEVVIVDMYSTDNTREFCESYPNVKFYERQDYIYANFNYGVEQATSDWIIRLDSDEVLNPELQKAVQEVLEDPQPKHSNYDALCHLFFFGMKLNHGYGNQWRTLLFRKGTAYYKARSEHEGLTVNGAPGQLRGFYEHFTNPTISEWISKINYYTDRDIERAPITPPRAWWRIVLDMARYFRFAYFGSGNLRHDGYLGFVVALISAFSLALAEMKKWERYEKRNTVVQPAPEPSLTKT